MQATGNTFFGYVLNVDKALSQQKGKEMKHNNAVQELY